MIANCNTAGHCSSSVSTRKFDGVGLDPAGPSRFSCVTETWLVPIEAWFVDKYGPRSWSVWRGDDRHRLGDELVCRLALEAYISAIVAGIGAGAVYGTCVGNALKWFPDHRGLAAGTTAAGFGAGSAITVVPIANDDCGESATRIHSSGSASGKA